jgi:hypothetical protein
MMGHNLLIHNPTNEYTKYYRDYNLFWDQLTDELKKENKVIENRYFKEAHISRSKIYLKKSLNILTRLLIKDTMSK